MQLVYHVLRMSLARRIFSNTAWQVMGKVITAVLGIVSVKFITNYLARSEYGQYTTIYDYTALFAIIADFGLFTIAVREMAHAGGDKKNVEKIVGNVLSIRTTLAVLALGLGVLVAIAVPAYGGTQIPFGVFIVSIATVLTLVSGTMSSVLQFYLRMQLASVALMIGKAITVGYILLTILYIFPRNPQSGFLHLLFAWILGGLFTIFMTYRASSKLINIKFQFDFIFWKDVLIKALPYGAALVLGTIYFRMGTIVLSMFKLQEDTGYFGVPLRFLEILQIIPHYFMNSVLPVLTMSIKNNNNPAKIMKYSLNALVSFAIPTLVGGFILAWPIIAAVSSPDFLTKRAADGSFIFGSDFALKILLVGITFTYLHVGLNYALVALGRQIELLWINGVTVIINITLNLLLVPRFGFIGAAVSAAVSEFIMLICMAFRTRYYIRGIWDFSFLAKTVFSAAVMGAVLFVTNGWLHDKLLTYSLLILIPVGGAVFAASMLATGAFSKEILALLKKPDPRQNMVE